MEEEGKTEAEAPIHGDLLESILTHVPLLDLVPASNVSRSWKTAVATSLRHRNTLKPWLLFHTHSTRSPYSPSTHAYDPRSRVWIEIVQPRVSSVSPLRSSHSTLLYTLSPSKFSFSFDPLHLTWHHIGAPLVWRTDPIVALVGRHVVVSGGVCDFEDDPLAVEMYDFEKRVWETCHSMPTLFKDCAASSFLSIATTSDAKMYVMEKVSGVTFAFDPLAKSWQGPYNLRPDPNISCSGIGISGDDCMILIGTIEDGEELQSVKLWEVKGEAMEIGKEIGEMPKMLVEKMRGEEYTVPSISVNSNGNMVYLINNSAPEEVFMCEVVGGGCCWSSVKNAVIDDNCLLRDRWLFTCSKVDLSVLSKAMSSEGTKFAVRHYCI